VVSGSLILIDMSIDDGSHQEDKDLNFVDMLEGDNDEGKSELRSLPSCFKPL